MQFARLASSFALACSLAAAHGQLPKLPLQRPQGPPPATIAVPAGNPSTPATLTPQDVSAFFDGFLPLQLQRDDVAGATISITQNGQPLLLKGYGYADWKKKTPVDPVTTTFRPGSISKLFVYVSMMQLVEQGKLSLDTDVNQYLDFSINPGPSGVGNAPITLRNLATHTAGFEEVNRDLGSDKSGKLPVDLRSFLIRDQPHRFALPGKSLAYSNYGIALIGYIIQRVSGESFIDYAQHHIFTPLGMTHSTFQQPLPAGMAATRGYLTTSKPDTGFEGWTPYPAGGLSSTAADMAIFGQMLLGHGSFNGQTILQPQSVALLLTPQFVPGPGVSPWDLGFYDEDRNGLRFIGHGGDLIACHSQFWIEPTHNLVFFISYNSAGAARIAREELFRAFVDRYLPGTPMPHPASLKLSPKDLAPYTGSFLSSRRADSTRMRVVEGTDVRTVASTKDGELTISTAKDFRGELVKFHPVGNDSFYQEESQNTLHFERDARCRVMGLASPSHADRAPFILDPVLFPTMLGAALLTVLFVCLATVVRLYRRVFHRRRASVAPQTGTRWLTFPIQLACWLILAVFAQFLATFLPLTTITSFYEIGHLDRAFVIQNILTALALIAIVFALVSTWRMHHQPLRRITRLKFNLVALACVYFAWFAFFFHFIGPAHRY